MPAIVAAAAGETMLAEAVAAPLFAADASFIPAVGGLADLAPMAGMGSAIGGGLAGLSTVAQNALPSLAGSGLAGVAPEAAAQINAATNAALPSATQLAPLQAANYTVPSFTPGPVVNEASIAQAQQAENAIDQAKALKLQAPQVDLGVGPVPEAPIDLGGGPVPNEPISLQETYPRGSSLEQQALRGTEKAYGPYYDNRFNPVEKQSSGFGGLGDLIQNAYGSAKKWIEDNPKTAAAGAGLAGYMLGKNSDGGTSSNQPGYSGPLSMFRYDPRRYTPLEVRPPTNPYMARYAMGGMLDDAGNPGVTMQGQNDPLAFQSTGVERMASGGLSDLGSYSDGGRMLKGPGDGMSDDIPATIAGKQPARLANEEFVIPADVVSHLGNGSSESGAKQLYKMMDRVRQARTGTKKQGKQINPNKLMPV